MPCGPEQEKGRQETAGEQSILPGRRRALAKVRLLFLLLECLLLTCSSERAGHSTGSSAGGSTPRSETVYLQKHFLAKAEDGSGAAHRVLFLHICLWVALLSGS